MTLAALTRESVLRAMDECDDAGQDQFLARHGFARSTTYLVERGDRQYDSKAIAGVAHRYATGLELKAGDFSGGMETVVPRLQALGFTFAENRQRRAWLALLKTEYRRLGGGPDKYDDSADSHYSWDSRVRNCRNVAVGDVIVLWDEVALIGASVIERIDGGTKSKPIRRCPVCLTTSFEARKSTPVFRCSKCKSEFDNPVLEEATVETFRSTHSQGWVDLDGVIRAKELRALCMKPSSQLSFRELRWDDFKTSVAARTSGQPLNIVESTSEQLAGGHATKSVRVRIGQRAFRSKLLETYGSHCAFTGPLPAASLEACHLYSFAEIGKHDPQGGLLLRRDLHRLFDHGLIAVDPEGIIDVSPEIRKFPLYAEIHGMNLRVNLTRKHREWIKLHWSQWR